MLGTHSETACWDCMLGSHPWDRMLGSNVEIACWESMLKSHVEIA